MRSLADDAEGYPLIQGILEESRAAGADLVYFGGGNARATGASRDHRNILFSMVGPHAVDALIVSGTMSHTLSDAQLKDFLGRYRPLPIVTIAIALEGFDSVICDNRRGMELVVEHLIECHGSRKLAFIGGPPGQQEAVDRKAAFLECLDRHAIAAKGDWIVDGDFSFESGAAACRALLAAGLKDAHALVAANDTMAMGALAVLKEAGLRVPQDILLAGFDDHEMSKSCEPPLTTAAQPFEEEARLAARMAIEAIGGPGGGRHEVLLPELVVRASCGCAPSQAESSEKRLPKVERRLREEAWLRYNEGLASRQLMESGEGLVDCHSLDELLDTFAREAPGVGLAEGWVSLFEPGDGPEGSAHLCLRWDAQGRQALPGGGLGSSGSEGIKEFGQSFRARDLVPGGIRALRWSGELLSIQSFYSHDKPLGFALWSTSAARMRSSGPVRNHFGIALEQTRLLDEVRRSHEGLLRAEKMAALGSLVAGVSHEINTPLGIALTAASLVQGKAQATLSALQGNSLKKSELEAALEVFAQTADLILSNLSRAADLVASFKQVAIDEGTLQRREFILGDYLKDLLLSLGPLWKHREVEVEIRPGLQIIMESYPGALAQVITNLMDNALKHAFQPGKRGRIELGWLLDSGQVVLRFTDNGRGIKPESIGKIFDPFFTTARAQGGTGLGLSIVYNLVDQVLGGKIDCVSMPGRGTEFTISIPPVAPGLENRGGSR